MPTKTVNVVLDALGLAAVSAAGFVLWLWLGLVLTGLSLLVLSWALSRPG